MRSKVNGFDGKWSGYLIHYDYTHWLKPFSGSRDDRRVTYRKLKLDHFIIEPSHVSIDSLINAFICWGDQKIVKTAYISCIHFIALFGLFIFSFFTMLLLFSNEKTKRSFNELHKRKISPTRWINGLVNQQKSAQIQDDLFNSNLIR